MAERIWDIGPGDVIRDRGRPIQGEVMFRELVSVPNGAEMAEEEGYLVKLPSGLLNIIMRADAEIVAYDLKSDARLTSIARQLLQRLEEDA